MKLDDQNETRNDQGDDLGNDPGNNRGDDYEREKKCYIFLKIMKKCKRKRCKSKNSKVFEQKGDLLSFKVNIDPKSGLMLSCAAPSKAELS